MHKATLHLSKTDHWVMLPWMRLKVAMLSVTTQIRPPAARAFSQFGFRLEEAVLFDLQEQRLSLQFVSQFGKSSATFRINSCSWSKPLAAILLTFTIFCAIKLLTTEYFRLIDTSHVCSITANCAAFLFNHRDTVPGAVLDTAGTLLTI